MNIKQVEKLINTNEQENINLAVQMLIKQVSTKNVFTILAWLKHKYSAILYLHEDLIQALEYKLIECDFKTGVKSSISEIFIHLLTIGTDIDQLKEVKEYYFFYIDSLIEQQEQMYNAKKSNERSSQNF
jgi:hypothetical protein